MSGTGGSTPTRGDELRRALVAVRTLRERVAELEARDVEPIAIVGMACRLPAGADTPEKAWTLLRDGVDATSDVPPDRWDVASLYDPDLEAPGRIYVKRGGFLSSPMDQFDAAFFGISPREAEAMDPLQRLLLELCWEALEHAGIPPQSLDGSSTGAYVGICGSEFEGLQYLEGGDLSQVHAYHGTGTASSVTGGRISHVLGLRGPNLSLDTACSSSLVATVLAVEHLRAGRCRMALAGGAQLIFGPGPTMFLCRLRALTPGGRCRTFDAGADGYARGEGGAIFVLKRLSDALADGDRVHALIRGGAINHDGHSSGLTVPNPAAQRAVIEAALANAGLRPEEIHYVEAHGTATPLGDPIEVRALHDAIGRHRDPEQPLLVGSIKTNIGHLEGAAGAAGLLKVVLAMEHGLLPRHLNCENPTPHVDWASIPIRVVREATPWPAPHGPWRAGVSAFGFSGTNAHLVVESAPPLAPREAPPPRGAELIVLSGKSRSAVKELAAAVADRVRSADPVSLIDVAHTLAAGRTHFHSRAAAVGADPASMAAALEQIATGHDSLIEASRPGATGRLGMLFTGQGAQYPGMARELIAGSGVFRREIERCDEILGDHMERRLLPLLLEEDDPEVLKQTQFAQPTLFAVEYALARLWASWGVEPSFVAGHSLGEYVAATVAGVMRLEDALPLIALRGRLMQALPAGGAMVAIDASEADVRSRVQGEGRVSIAAINGPTSTVISGDADAVRRVSEAFASEGVRCRELEVSHAFHSHRMEPMLDEFEQAVAAMALHAPELGLVSNVTGDLMTPEEATDPARWRRHIREPVRFLDSLATLGAQDVRTFVEAGPHPTLLAMGAAALPGSGYRWVPSIRRGQGQWARLLESLGELYRAGHDIDWRAFGADRGGRLTDAPTYRFQRVRHWPFAEARKSSGARMATEVVHPLLGAPFDSPAVQGWAFQQTLDTRTPPWLSDHRFGGDVLVPAAAYVEMAFAAAVHGPAWAGVEIRDLTLDRPLVIPEGTSVVVQTLLSPIEGGTSRLRIVARPLVEDPAASRWSTVATARVAPGMPAPDASALDAWREPSEPADMAFIYSSLEERGLVYGPAFRVIGEARADAHCALADVALQGREARDARSYTIHPALFDSALHLIGAIVAWNPELRSTWLPFSIDRIRFAQPAGERAELRVHLRESAQDDPELPKADFALTDTSGRILGVVEGFQARKVAVTRTHRGNDLTYEVAWRPIAPPAQTRAPAGRWLVLDDGNDVAEALAARLVAAGVDCTRLRLSEEAALATLEGSFDGLVHAGALDEVPSAADAQRLAITRALLPVSRLLADGRLADGARLRFLTRGAQGPRRGEGDRWQVGAGVWGAFVVLRAERAELAARVIDLDPAAPPDPDALDAWLFAESPEDRVALRDGSALGARLARRTPTAAERTPGIVFAENYRLEIERRGSLEGVHFVRTGRTPPGPGMVEVRVAATGLNFRDVLNVLGQYPGDPGPPGLEFAGIVERVGEGVTSVAPGDEVVGMHPSTFTAYATMPALSVVPKPASLTTEEAAGIPVAFLTAEWGLMRLARLRAGERVLIHAGAGGVGQAAIQVARAAGARVFATAGSEAKRQLLRDQGVEGAFDSRSPSFYEDVRAATGGEGVDVVLNSLTGELLQRSLDLLSEGGRFIELGKMEIFDADELRKRRGIEYAAFELGTIPLEKAEFHDFFASVLARFDTGELRSAKVRTFPADETVDAMRYMAQARHVGKVVIRSALVRPAEPIRRDGTYLVTGATGGIGPQLVEWLVARGAGAVVVSSRSEPTGTAAETFDRLRRGGAAVEFERADMSREEDVERLVARARSAGPALRGVFHAAGVLDDRSIQDIDRESYLRVLGPKVIGAVTLDRLTREDELDHFVLFSSAAAIVGGAGQAAYAAGNAYLDTLAHARRRSALPALSVEWGAWGGAGMAHRLDERQKRAMERGGTRFLEPDAAFASLESLLLSPLATSMVADIDWSFLAGAGAQVPPFVRELGAGGDGAGTAAAARLDRDELKRMDGPARKAKVEEFVIATVAAVLGLAPDQLDSDTVVSVLGFDSLMAVELRNRIDAELSVTLPTGELLGGGTVGEMAALLDTRLSVDELGEEASSQEPVETFEI